MKYIDLRREAQTGFRDLTEKQIQFNVEKNKEQLNFELVGTKNTLSELKRNLVLVKSRENLDANEIINKTIQIEDFEKAVIVLEKAIEELF